MSDLSALLQDAAGRAVNYLSRIDARNVAPPPAVLASLANFDEPLPEEPTDPAEMLRLLDEYASPGTMASAGGRFFGFVIGGSLPAALAANWMAGAWDQNAGLVATSPASAALEEVTARWLLEVLGLPTGCATAFVSGATMANFTGLAAGRRAVLGRLGWDVEAQGLFGAPPVTIVIGEETHPSVTKAIGLLGFGRNRVTVVPTDDQGRLMPNELPSLEAPAIVCIQAGNVNTGASDPAVDICAKAHDSGAWVHVDGAFGLWAQAAPGRAHLVAGMADADSWATDAHKWLNVPYDSGLAFVREPEYLRGAMSVSADYLPTSERREPSQYTPELSRRARGVEIWAVLRSLGRRGLAELVERTCRHAERFAGGLRDAGYDILNDVVLNQVLVSFGDAETTDRVIAGIQQDGTCWCGGTTWQGRRAMRISVSSWATTEEDVERSLAAMRLIAARDLRQAGKR